MTTYNVHSMHIFDIIQLYCPIYYISNKTQLFVFIYGYSHKNRKKHSDIVIYQHEHPHFSFNKEFWNF